MFEFLDPIPGSAFCARERHQARALLGRKAPLRRDRRAFSTVVARPNVHGGAAKMRRFSLMRTDCRRPAWPQGRGGQARAERSIPNWRFSGQERQWAGHRPAARDRHLARFGRLTNHWRPGRQPPRPSGPSRIPRHRCAARRGRRVPGRCRAAAGSRREP